MAVCSPTFLGGALSVGKEVRLMNSVSLTDGTKLMFNSAGTTYVEHSPAPSSPIMKFFFNGARRMELVNTGMGTGGSSGGGTLHGTWSSDSTISTSDRRLKENIRPIRESLNEAMHNAQPELQDDLAAGAAGWILRELRPVSYNFLPSENMAEPDKRRFGFIAQEVQGVLPAVTRHDLPGHHRLPGMAGIVYQDFIAVLTAMVQDLGDGIAALQPRLHDVEGRIRHRKAWKAQQASKVSPQHKFATPLSSVA